MFYMPRGTFTPRFMLLNRLRLRRNTSVLMGMDRYRVWIP